MVEPKLPDAEVTDNSSTIPRPGVSQCQASPRMTWHPALSTVSLNKRGQEMSDSAMRYAIVIEDAGDNYSAYVPDLPGCVATGSTLEETEAAMRDAMLFHLDGLRADNLPIPKASSRVEYVEVAA